MTRNRPAGCGPSLSACAGFSPRRTGSPLKECSMFDLEQLRSKWMADKEPLSPRDQILGAVLTAIEKHGIDSLTTRKIAEEAGTNIASINYYFRSKDLLVEE